VQILIERMSSIPVGYKPRLRELTIGPVAWGLWSLTYHDGSTYAALALDGGDKPEHIVGWAACTLEYDEHPMIGAYVLEAHRGKGIAASLVTSLLRDLRGRGVLSPGDVVVASTWRWPLYGALIASCGLTPQTWE